MSRETKHPLTENEDDYGWMDDDPFFNEEFDEYIENTRCCSIGAIAARAGQPNPLLTEPADEIVIVCAFCGKPITGFRDVLSEKEYRISGLCQECQDGVFEV